MLVLDFYTGLPSSTHMAEIVNNDPPGFVVHKIPGLGLSFFFCVESICQSVFAVLCVLYLLCCECCICCVVSVDKPNISYLIKDFLFPLKPFLI